MMLIYRWLLTEVNNLQIELNFTFKSDDSIYSRLCQDCAWLVCVISVMSIVIYRGLPLLILKDVSGIQTQLFCSLASSDRGGLISCSIQRLILVVHIYYMNWSVQSRHWRLDYYPVGVQSKMKSVLLEIIFCWAGKTRMGGPPLFVFN